MLVDAGAPANILGGTDYSPLHLAARGGYIQIMSLLLKNAAIPDLPTQFEKRTALHIAAGCWILHQLTV